MRALFQAFFEKCIGITNRFSPLVEIACNALSESPIWKLKDESTAELSIGDSATIVFCGAHIEETEVYAFIKF